MITQRQNGIQHQHGFNLIEVLITLLVLSIGLLGLAGLQLKGLKTNQMANFTTQAVYLAYEMADRIRANPNGNIIYNMAITKTLPPHPAIMCDTTPCNNTELATYDMYQWLKDITSRLPNGSGQITRTIVNGLPTFTITVRWDEERKGATGTDCPRNSEDDLNCYRIQVNL